MLKIFAGNQNQAYRSVMKTLLLLSHTHSWQVVGLCG